MSDPDFLLAVLTHGWSPDLCRCLDSFAARVRPSPAAGVLWVDGPDLGDTAARIVLGRGGLDCDWTLDGSAVQRGFCASTADLWEAAANDFDQPFVFWLESDFEFVEDVDLGEVAAVLIEDPSLAQMALCRDAANEAERAAGGLVESRPGEFESYATHLEHRSYFTTTPSLMQREFMEANPFLDDGLAECEGRFGIELVRRGYRFGLFGDGSVYVRHVGVRTGKGY